MASIGELFVALGFKVDDKALKGFDNKLKTMKKNLLVIPAVAGAAAFAIDRFAASAFNAAVALQNFNMQTGLMGSTLRQFQVAGELSDISLSADQVTSSIQNLQSNLTAISRGEGNVKPFGFLGISTIGKDAFQVLEEMRQSIKGLSPALATSLISEAGLDPKFINLLRLSNKEFKTMGSQFILSDAANKKLVTLGTSFTKLKMSLVFLKDKFVAFIAKPLTGLANFLGVVIKKLTLVGEAISDSIDAFVSLGRTIYSFFGRATPLVDAFGKAIALLGLGMAIAFAPVTATLLGLLLILEDIAVFNKGGNSLIGLAFDELREFGEWFKSIFTDIGDSIQENIVKPLREVMGLSEVDSSTGKSKGFLDTLSFDGALGRTLADLFAGGTPLPLMEGVGAPITQNNVFNIQSNDMETSVNAAKKLQNNSSISLMQLNNGVVN